MPHLPNELRGLIESGPMAHLSTINPDGSPALAALAVPDDQRATVWVQICLGQRQRFTDPQTAPPPRRRPRRA